MTYNTVNSLNSKHKDYGKHTTNIYDERLMVTR